ncbi:unnamed protein product [Prunus armeniaca]
MRQHKLKMNPKKCAFGVQAGNFLGKIQPFSSLLRLKQEQEFKWEEQHQQAFEEIKHYLSNPPVLSSPKRGRPLKLYVSALEVSIGSLLVQDNKEGKEKAVFSFLLFPLAEGIASTLICSASVSCASPSSPKGSSKSPAVVTEEIAQRRMG